MEKDAHQSFLWACGAAFQACFNDTLAKLMYPLHLLMGSPSLPRPLTATLPLTTRKGILLPPPVSLAGPPPWCPLPGPNNNDL